jgi:hypothetical protein
MQHTRSLLFLWIAWLLTVLNRHLLADDHLAARLRQARLGTTVEVPPGIHTVGDLVLPPGVSLKGAGYESAIIEARGHTVGVLVRAGTEAAISDLTIRGAWERALMIRKGQGIMIRRVRLRGDVSGLVILTSWSHQVEWLGMTDSGLGLGRLGFPDATRWGGYWVDHPDHYHLFHGNDGNLHVLVGDYVINAMHWLTLKATRPLRQASVPVEISLARAQRLSAEPASSLAMAPRPAQPKILIRRLSEPLPINGDPARWRKAGISPQIVITPVTGHGTISGPGDLGRAAK